jgi:hypothetical protein
MNHDLDAVAAAAQIRMADEVDVARRNRIHLVVSPVEHFPEKWSPAFRIGNATNIASSAPIPKFASLRGTLSCELLLLTQ